MGVEKTGFGKVAVSRAFRLRECPLGELPVHSKRNTSSHLVDAAAGIFG